MVALKAKNNSPSVPVNLKQPDLNGGGSRRKHSRVNCRSVRLPVISVAIIDQHLFTRECVAKALQRLGVNLEIASFATCHDFLQSTNTHDLVLYYPHERLGHHGCDAQQLACLTKLMKITPLIILSDFDYPELIFEAFESGASAFIPTTTTSIKLAIEIIRLIQAGGTFVPRSTLSLREPDREGTGFSAATNHRLTPRQMRVLDLLRRGKANKIIAYQLGVSESTVKIEIHNIMKKMNATNRTEIVCRAYAFAPSDGA